MSRSAVSPLPGLLAVAMLAAYFGGCGDGDSTSPASTGTSTQSTPARSAPAAKGPSVANPSGGQAGSGGSSESGTVSPRSAPFHRYSAQSQLHLAEFGTEAGGGQREAARSVLEAYLQATKEGRWDRACRYLLAATRSQTQEFAVQIDPARAKSCAGALALVFATQSTGTHIQASEGIASLRVKPGAGAGFALFHGSDGVDHWMAMKIEGGGWKVLSIAPQPFR